MKLGTQVGLGTGHIVLQMAAWIKMPLGMEVALGPADFVLDGDTARPSPKRGQTLPPQKNRPLFIVAKHLAGSR